MLQPTCNAQFCLAIYTITPFCIAGQWELKDEAANFQQKHDVELIKESKRYGRASNMICRKGPG